MVKVPHFSGQHNLLTMRPIVKNGLEDVSETRIWVEVDAICIEDDRRGFRTMTIESAKHRRDAMKDVLDHPDSRRLGSHFDQRTLKAWHDKLSQLILVAEENRVKMGITKAHRVADPHSVLSTNRRKKKRPARRIG
jgi:hypothetical protein